MFALLDFFALGCLALATFVGGWLLAAAWAAAGMPAWLPQLRGRLRAYALVGLPFMLGVLMLPFPESIGMACCFGMSVAWWHTRRELLASLEQTRIKAVDVGSGVRMIAESGGPVPEALREELELWQRAGATALRETAWPEEGR